MYLLFTVREPFATRENPTGKIVEIHPSGHRLSLFELRSYRVIEITDREYQAIRVAYQQGESFYYDFRLRRVMKFEKVKDELCNR